MLFSVLSACLILAAPGQRVQSLTGEIRKHPGFHSAILNNDRNLTVYLPPDYEAHPNLRYPVLYMHDGQNIFDGMTSYIPNMEWQADETAQRLIGEGKIVPLIIVGIDNGGMARGDEYLPTRAKVSFSKEPLGGKADLYGKMLTDEVMPLINRTYRTVTGPENTGVLGSSFGGIVSLYLGLTRPNVFGKVGVLSPSIWWDDRVMIKQVMALRAKPQQKIWLDMGTKEGYEGLLDARKLKYALLDKGWVLGKDLAYMEDPGAVHNEGAWSKRLPAILRFLFPAR